MSDTNKLGGVIHTYQKYDPAECPPPTAEPLKSASDDPESGEPDLSSEA